MTPRIPWFERPFAFAFEAELYPGIIERLRGLLPRIESRVGALSAELLTWRMDETWSIQENIGHVLDLEPLWAGRLRDFVDHAEVLRPADLENRKTHQAAHNRAPLGALVAELRDNRQDLVDGLSELKPADFARSSRHPRLDQPMRLVDLMYFVAEHDDHHLARVTEILRAARARGIE